MVRVAEPVGRVGVATEGDVGPAVAHLLENLDIPARLAFELNAPIAGGQFPLNGCHQLGDGGLNAQGNAAGNHFAHPAQQLRK